MTVMADALLKALDEKKNDVNSFIWKGEKVRTKDSFSQPEVKMMDATPKQLQNFYNRCAIMLYNPSKKNPGREVLIKEIDDQIENCNAELFLRCIEKGNPETGIKPIPRFSYFQSLKEFLDNNEDAIPRKMYKEVGSITRITKVAEEFSRLSIDKVYCACIDSLGFFKKKHITGNFLCKLGLWFTNKEMVDLTEHDSNGKVVNRLKVVKTRLNLKPWMNLHLDSNGLTYKEFRAMVTLKNCKYSEMTTDQLYILRTTILNKLRNTVKDHSDQWKERMAQILKVCQIRNISIETDEQKILSNMPRE